MSNRVPLTPEELQDHLREQLELLQLAAASYDEGLDSAAKYLALTIRVLVHDGRGSTRSLLGQLSMLSGSFLSTALPPVEGSVSTHHGLVMMGLAGRDARKYLAMLDDVPYKNCVPFETWWTEVIIIDSDRAELSRRDLVLVAANQDGGGHVDPSLDATYRRLTKENSLGWTYHSEGQDRPIRLPERAAIRQVAHELLVTLLPGYSKKPDHQVGVFAGGMVLMDGPDVPPPPRTAQAKRNDPCPCGSGRKYKKCHGRVN